MKDDGNDDGGGSDGQIGVDACCGTEERFRSKRDNLREREIRAREQMSLLLLSKVWVKIEGVHGTRWYVLMSDLLAALVEVIGSECSQTITCKHRLTISLHQSSAFVSSQDLEQD